MLIGIPKEILPAEKRVAATPETVKKYINLGFDVMVESGAGEGIYHTDEDYKNAGAVIESDTEKLFNDADIILKVKQLHYNENTKKHEVEMLREGSTVITFLHPAAPGSHQMVKDLRDKNITAFTMDGIPRISRAQRMDALTSMSTITGYKSVLMAANYLPKFVPMIGTAIGMIKPANFLIVGAGVVGLQAIATAKRLGGIVKVIDIRKNACQEAQSLGAKVVEFDIPENLAMASGGYAKSLNKEWVEKERALIAENVNDIDVIITSALVPGELAPVLITEEIIKKLKPGSVVVDVGIDQGGNCELTQAGVDVVKHNVLISGIANIPGRMPIPSSWLYANNIYQYVENLYKNGIDKPNFDDEIVMNSLVTRNGKIVHEGTLKAMNG